MPRKASVPPDTVATSVYLAVEQREALADIQAALRREHAEHASLSDLSRVAVDLALADKRFPKRVLDRIKAGAPTD